MKTASYVKILLLCILAIGFVSCEDEYYTDDYLRNSDDKLCGKTWVDEYAIEGNEFCIHQLKFAKDYSGREVFQFYRNGENRPYKENSYTFDWKWTDAAMENIEINYGGGDIIYFDNVWVREHNLQGKLDGVVVMFVDADLL